MTPSSVLVDQAGHVLTVTLNRPEQRNAFDDPMRREMRDLWTEVRDDRSVRCVVLTGAGKGFCAGADMGVLDGDRAPFGDGIDDELCFLPGRRLEVPVIVAVNGVCAGGGLHYVADADIVIASEDAWFTDPHVGVGQVSGIEAPSLGLRVPLGMLARMVLLGRHERWDAEQALQLGLVSEVVPRDELLPRAQELAGWVAEASPEAVRRSRAVYRRFEEAVVGDAMADGWDWVQRHWAHPDSDEGPRAFLERRERGVAAMSDDLTTTPLPADIVGMLEGLTSTRAIRHYTDDPVPPEALRAMLFAASRAPSGSNRQPFRFIVLTDGPNARAAKTMIAEGARAAWGGKRVSDRYDEGSGARDDSPKARMARAMQRYVDEFDQVPVLVLPALVRYREPTPFEGASVFPACQNLLLAARALGYGGVLTGWHFAVESELKQLLGVPEDVFLAATITIGKPAGHHGPVRRRPLAELVYGEAWEHAPDWAVDPPGAEHTAAGPPRPAP